MAFLLEICVETLASARAARAGGADRLELCASLAEGGLTPGPGLLRAGMATGLPVMVMIRPRGGDFVFDEDEVQLMIHDIAAARSAGAAGVVIGMLLPDGQIDTINCRRLVAAARPMQVTFHRAFDHAADPVSALEQVISLGADWLLTSGQAQGAEAGIPLLRQLVVQARGRIQLMAGAGISPRNAALIRSATGVQALHASARKPHPSPMSFQREGVPMGLPGLDAWQRMETDPDLVRAIRAAAVSTAPY